MAPYGTHKGFFCNCCDNPAPATRHAGAIRSHNKRTMRRNYKRKARQEGKRIILAVMAE